MRPLLEIIETLDQDGCLNGLPFMPEMAELCGRNFRVRRVANKSCVKDADGAFVGSITDGYILQTSHRCDGSAHDGCQMACNFVWKRQWLDKEACRVGPSRVRTDLDFERGQALKVVAKTTRSNGCFRCQATELAKISTRTSPLNVGQYIEDYRSGIGAVPIAKGMMRSLGRRLARKRTSLSGPCTKTPVSALNLKVGEMVVVKSLDQIHLSLDRNGCNRGLWFDSEEMARYCGTKLIVSRVIRRLIDEVTGNLKQLSIPCIVLSETECSGVFRRFCSRGMLHFWREIWLQRLDS